MNKIGSDSIRHVSLCAYPLPRSFKVQGSV